MIRVHTYFFVVAKVWTPDLAYVMHCSYQLSSAHDDTFFFCYNGINWVFVKTNKWFFLSFGSFFSKYGLKYFPFQESWYFSWI